MCLTSDVNVYIYYYVTLKLFHHRMPQIKFLTQMVRMEAAKTLITLNLYARAAEEVIRRLADFDPSVRAHAITSLVCAYTLFTIHIEMQCS